MNRTEKETVQRRKKPKERSRHGRREGWKLEEKRLFQIGEMARMFHISMGTLRHYEQSGLLTPEYVDPQTGYRYYGARQLEVLNTIRYMRVLDLPLSQIQTFLKNRDTDVMEEMLEKQKALIVEKQRELERISRKIDHRLEQLRDAMDSELDRICLVQSPALRLVWIADELAPKSYLDLEYSIRRLVKNQKEALVFLGKVGVGITKEHLEKGEFSSYNLVYMILDEEDSYEGKVENLPESLCVMVRFRGSHLEAAAYYEKLWAYMEKHRLIPAGFSREITLIDNGLTQDPEKFVTEIRIPVLPG